MKQRGDADTLLSILRNLYRQDARGLYPASNLADIVAELNRRHPGQGGSLDGGDYKTLLGETRDFFLDNDRGFLRFVGIVKTRGPAQ